MPEPSSSPLVPIPEDDEELLRECRVDVFRAGGPGGQHQNTTESGVRLTHLPTGVTAVARDHRSQHRNRRLALERLRVRIELLQEKPKPRIATRPSRASKNKGMKLKKQKSAKKRLRKRPRLDDT
jgi:ribosome-associated protein